MEALWLERYINSMLLAWDHAVISRIKSRPPLLVKMGNYPSWVYAGLLERGVCFFLSSSEYDHARFISFDR